MITRISHGDCPAGPHAGRFEPLRVPPVLEIGLLRAGSEAMMLA